LHTESAVDGKDKADGNKPTAEAVVKATKAQCRRDGVTVQSSDNNHT